MGSMAAKPVQVSLQTGFGVAMAVSILHVDIRIFSTCTEKGPQCALGAIDEEIRIHDTVDIVLSTACQEQSSSVQGHGEQVLVQTIKVQFDSGHRLLLGLVIVPGEENRKQSLGIQYLGI